jgi:HEAT repeat protein
MLRPICLILCLASALGAQDPASSNPKDRQKAAEEFGKQGSEAIPKLEPLLKDPATEVRVEAVKAIVKIGTQRSLDPLIEATTDNDAEIQIRATDGLVNFYIPGYVESGLTASIKRAGNLVTSRWSDRSDHIIPSTMQVRPEIIDALGKLVRGGVSMETRANAARAVGVLRGKAALPDLLQALRTKNGRVIYEVLIAIQKIRASEAAPEIAFLLRDLDEKVQIAAIETAGLLQNKDALPGLRDALLRTDKSKVRRAALTAIAMIPDETNRPIYEKHFEDKDDAMRAAAAEGIGRLKNPADLEKVERAFASERKMNPRLSLAFAAVSLGKTQMSEFSPLQYLVNTLNSRAYRGVAEPFLVELARKPEVRSNLYPVLFSGNQTERTQLAHVLARSGDAQTLPHLEKVAKDSNPEIAREGLRALQLLRARLE